MKTMLERFLIAVGLAALAAHSPLLAEESAPVIYRLSKSASNVLGGALTNAVYWLDESGAQCAESATLDSNADYIVGLKRPDENGATYCKNIRTGEQDIVFAGKSLTIGDDTWSDGDGVFYFSRYKGTVRFLNEGLFLRYGRMELVKHSNVEFNAYGKVTILADGSGKGNFHHCYPITDRL